MTERDSVQCGSVLLSGITCTRPAGHGGTHWSKEINKEAYWDDRKPVAAKSVPTERDSVQPPPWIETAIDEFAEWLYSIRCARIYSSERLKLAQIIAEHAKEQSASTRRVGPLQITEVRCPQCDEIFPVRVDLGPIEAAQSTPDKCPQCGSTDKAIRFTSHFAGVPIQDCQDEWHAATPKGSK
jgi:rubrerythrin